MNIEAEKDELSRIAYYSRLAYDRKKYGSYVYIHTEPPKMPKLIKVKIERWRRSNNPNHSDIYISVGEHLNFAENRCYAVFQAAQKALQGK